MVRSRNKQWGLMCFALVFAVLLSSSVFSLPTAPAAGENPGSPSVSSEDRDEDSVTEGSDSGDDSSSSSSGTGFPRCVGGNIEQASGGAIQRCIRYKEKFEQYAEESGLNERGVGLLYLFVLAAGESGCRSISAGDDRAANGGIMQTISKCTRNPSTNQCQTVDDEIRFGTEAVARMTDMVTGLGFSGRDAALMVLLAFNRGPGPVRKAKELIDEQGIGIEDAAQQGCAHYYANFDVFPNRRNFCYSWVPSRHNCDGNRGDSMCEGGKSCAYYSGCRLESDDLEIKIHYAGKRWANYERTCEEIGGHIENTGGALTPDTGASGSGGDSGVGAEALGIDIKHPYFTVPYSIDPSFSVDIPYDFSVYDEIPELLRRLERCRDNIECVVNNVSLIEGENPAFDWIVSYGGNVLSKDSGGEFEYPAWQAYCETPDTHALNSLSEAIDTCTRSQSTDCVCPYSLPIVTEEDMNRWYGIGLSYGLALIPGIGPILGIASFVATMTSDNLDWEERIFQFQQTRQGMRITMRAPSQGNAHIVPNSRFKSVEGAIRGDQDSLLRYVPADDDQVIHIYKDDRSNMSLYLDGDAPSEELCELHNKIVKFCIIQNQTFMAYNEQDNRMGLQQLVLKFAYLFGSEVTDVRNFEVRDAKMASNKSLLIWDPVEGVDVDHYTIYYSENSAMEANLGSTAPSAIPDDVREDLNMIELPVLDQERISIGIDSLDEPSCNVFGTQCTLGYRLHTVMGDEMSDAILDDRTLFYSTPEDRFFYFLPNIRNDHNYFFAITVTDVNGQESPGFNTPEEGMYEDSEDDVPPGLASIRSVQLNPGTNDVEFTIDPLDYGVDGSPSDPSDITNYKIYCAAEGLSGVYNLSDHEAMFAQGISSNDDGSVTFSRPVSDFTDFACGITGAPRLAKFVIAGVKRIGAADVDFRGSVDVSSFSLPVNLPDS